MVVGGSGMVVGGSGMVVGGSSMVVGGVFTPDDAASRRGLTPRSGTMLDIVDADGSGCVDIFLLGTKTFGDSP